MSYEVLARKWRPQQFDELVGQDHVTQTLKNALESERIAHAYLFVGPRGIGKTSVARIFSKALNCENGPTIEPCDKCDSCLEVTAGTNLDVLEIDGASNNGVEQVRDLRETVKYAPNKGRFKIYIIDEVHMLSTAAFNALLKTLEEPPEHVKFIFATTEPQKILATIVSRCQRFDLRRIPVPLIIERLELIAKSENVEVSEDALLAVARGAEGGLRDAESALDQLISFKGSNIDEEDVLSVFGLTSRSTLEELAGMILEGNIKVLVKMISELDEAGKDMQRLNLELMEHFRNLVVCINVDDDSYALDLTAAQMQVLKKQASSTNTGKVLRVTSILSETADKMRYALSRKTLFETALIRCSRAATVVTLPEVMRSIEELKKNFENGVTSVVLNDAPEPASSELPLIDSEQEIVAHIPDEVSEEDSNDLELLNDKWTEVIEIVGRTAPFARSVLVDSKAHSVTDTKVVVAFEPEFADEIANFKSGRNRKAVERAIASVLKRDVAVEYIVGEETEIVVDDSDRDETITSEKSEDVKVDEPEVAKEDSAEEVSEEDKRALLNDDAVTKTMLAFDGEIVGLR